MNFQEYQSIQAANFSGLKMILKTPAHYFAAYLDPEREPQKPTPAMAFGKAWHSYIFEGQSFNDEYAIIPEGLDRRTKEGKALYLDLESRGITTISEKDANTIFKMAAALTKNSACYSALTSQGNPEFTITWDDAEFIGVKCKARMDYCVPPCADYPNGLIIDGKTTDDASPEGFGKSIWQYKYHMQAAFYSDGFMSHFGTSEPPAFMLIAQEKTAPYLCAAYSIPDDLLEFGRAEYRKALDTYALCMRNNVWPGYSQSVTDATTPAWAQKQINEELDDNEVIGYV